VVLVSVKGREDRGFESRRGVRILGLKNIAMLYFVTSFELIFE
jgi:hypothetical protein